MEEFALMQPSKDEAFRINQSINQSINQKHICKAPYVAGESEAHSGRD